MRIAIIGSRGFPHVYSGYETLVAELAPRLVAKGHDVLVYCHAPLFPARPARVRGVRLAYVPAIESKSLGTLSNGFLSTLDAVRRRPDVILYVNAANGFFGPLTRCLGIPSAINVDGLEWLRPKWKGLGARVFRAAAWMATRTMDRVITDADAMAAVYREEFGAASDVIAYGAYPRGSAQPRLIEAFGLEPQGYYLVVGRLIPDNNADLIVKGFERCRSKRRLVIVGDVPYRDRYAEGVRATKDPRVLFTGYVKDPALLAELYCHAYAYLHGHEFGGTNPTLLKALGFGCCILALDTVFSREVLRGDTHGIPFGKSPEALAACLDGVDLDEARVAAFRGRARSRIQERYTWDRVADEYEACLSRVARGG
jgi:glycosyltransferase involved in cell wall biosynthesis